MRQPQHQPMAGSGDVYDLRSALERLKAIPGQLLTSDRAVDPHAELAGVYKRIGAGGTVMRPTRTGPAMLFESIKGFPGARVLVGLMADRARVALLLGARPEALAAHVGAAVERPVAPALVDGAGAPCQERVLRADDPAFDLRRLLPAPTNTELDAGPYFCLGLVLGSDPDEGHSDVTIHRLCVQSRDELSIFFAPGRHIDVFREKAEARGEPLPVTINMGLDPAIYVASCFEAPTTPLGFDELAIAGALRGRPVELVPAVAVRQRAIARAEIVIEGEILPGRRVREDQNTGTGHAMPEFERALPGFVRNVYAHSAGGGKLLAVIQVAQRSALDQGRARQAALVALGAYRELKNVILVDDDVDLFDSDDVLWAMQTRYQGDLDTVFLPGVAGHVLDPSQAPEYSPSIPARGVTCKTIFDCTYPWPLHEQFARARFRDVDPAPFAPELFTGAGDS